MKWYARKDATHAMNERMNGWMYIPLTGDVRRRITNDVTPSRRCFPSPCRHSVSDSAGINQIKSNQVSQSVSRLFFPVFIQILVDLVDLEI